MSKNTSKKKRRRIVTASDIVPAGSTRESGNLPDEPSEAAVTIIPEGVNQTEALESAAEEPPTAIDETTIPAEETGAGDGDDEIALGATGSEVPASEATRSRGKKKKRGKGAHVEARRDEPSASDEDKTDEIVPETVRGASSRSAEDESADGEARADDADGESSADRASDEIAPGPIDTETGREIEGAASDDDDETTVPGATDLADGARDANANGADEDEATEPAAHGDELWTPDELEPPASTVPAVDVSRAHLKGLIEALVFVSDQPLSINEIAKAAGKADRKLVRALADELRQEFARRGIHLDEVAGGLIFRTNPAYAPFIRDAAAKKPVKMTRAQLETLSIIAYRQPLTRPEVDEIRGVDSGPVMKMLLERDLVRILGKKDEPGRPLLYGTTNTFLEFFGLKALKDLPSLREFTELSDDSRKTFERELGDLPEGMEPNASALAAAASAAGSREGVENGENSMGPDAPTVVPGARLDDENAGPGDSEAAETDATLGAALDSDEETTTQADRETLAASDEDADGAIEDAPETADADELSAQADEELADSAEETAEEHAESDEEVVTATDEETLAEAAEDDADAESDEEVATTTDEETVAESDEERAEADEESEPESDEDVATASEGAKRNESDEDELSADEERVSSDTERGEVEADSRGSNSGESDAEM